MGANEGERAYYCPYQKDYCKHKGPIETKPDCRQCENYTGGN